MREEIEGKISKTSARLKAKMNIYILIVKHTRSNKSNAHVSVAYNSFILCLIYLSLRIVSSLGSCTEVNNWRDQKADARNAHVSENQENAESILTCYRAVSRPSWTFRWRPCQWRRRWSFVSFGLGQWIACLLNIFIKSVFMPLSLLSVLFFCALFFSFFLEDQKLNYVVPSQHRYRASAVKNDTLLSWLIYDSSFFFWSRVHFFLLSSWENLHIYHGGSPKEWRKAW